MNQRHASSLRRPAGGLARRSLGRAAAFGVALRPACFARMARFTELAGLGRQARQARLACLAALVLLLCLLSVSACIEKKPIPLPPVEEKKVEEPQPVKAPPPPKKEPVKATPRYSSLEGFKVRTLRESEARNLARRMQPEQQGLKSWNDLKFAVTQSLEYAMGRPEDGIAVTYPTKPPISVTWKEIRASLVRMLEILPYLDDNPALLAAEFKWLALSPKFLFTGYYEPTMYASYRPSPMYNFPLYAKPPELQTGKLFHDRHNIDRKGALAGRGLELAWVRDEVDAFFLQIQGSGRLVFPDGKSKHVLYAGKNGHPYVPIGAVLRDKGLLDENNISMPTIRSCLLENANRKGELLDTNPSYVFFRLADDGPLGSMGRNLTPRVSLAVDPRVLPHGSMVFFSTKLPNQLGVHNRPINAVCLPQDSGGAIKGRRIDFFMGAGKAAEHIAGHMNQEGEVYLLLPVKGGSFTSQGRR